MKTYRVKEIFGPTLQGEGQHAGKAVYFVRLANCNRWNGRPASKINSICYYCDTDFTGGDIMSATQIRALVNCLMLEASPTTFHRPTVVISGGEPMLQVDEEFLSTLHELADLHIETNGSIEIPENLRHYFECITVSPKQRADETKVKSPHVLKFLYPWIDPMIRPEAFFTMESEVFIQPIDDPSYPDNLSGAIEHCIANPKFRLSLQTHKILNLR